MKLWGDKTVSWFDIWSIEHFVAGMTLVSIMYPLFQRCCNNYLEMDSEKKAVFINAGMLLVTLFLAYFWETIEHYAENGSTGIDAVTYWFQGVEFWGNRIITDPFLVFAGGIVAIRNPSIRWPARVFSHTWVFTHVCVFPHSMYLHQLYF